MCGIQYSDVMIDFDELYTNHTLELRRGTIVLALLSQLQRPLYGYALLQTLEDSGISIDAGTLYPLLRRLEKQGVLDSSWDTTDTRPRKYYRLNAEGKLLYQRMANEWFIVSKKLSRMIEKDQ